VCKGGEYPLPLYMLRFIFENMHVGADNVLGTWPRVKSNAGHQMWGDVNTLRARIQLCISAKAG
jgi:hypothetical protein